MEVAGSRIRPASVTRLHIPPLGYSNMYLLDHTFRGTDFRKSCVVCVNLQRYHRSYTPSAYGTRARHRQSVTQTITSSSGSYYILFSFFCLVSWVGLRLSPLGTSRTTDDECGAVNGMRTGSGNRRAWRKPAPAPLYPPQITHDLTWD
jgi:hypothetical protein